MPENPFDQSTLVTDASITYLLPPSTPRALSNAIELRYQPIQRTLIPAAIAVSGVVVPIILFFSLSAPMNILMAAVTAMMEFSMAAFMYFLFNSAFVRADDAGVTKSQLGQTQSVRWEEIADMGVLQIGNGPYQIHFKDASGKEIFKFSTLGNREAGEKLWEFIDKKLEAQFSNSDF